MSAGADYFVLKPFDYDVLCERIDCILNSGTQLVSKNERISLDEVDLEVMVTNV